MSATTRDPRPGETHGVHYWFLEPDEFAALLATGDLLEWAEYNGRQYGTLRKPVMDHLAAGEDVLLEIEVQGARQVRATHPDAVMFFIVPPGLDELEGRLRRRGDTSEADIRRRLEIARREMEEAERLVRPRRRQRRAGTGDRGGGPADGSAAGGRESKVRPPDDGRSSTRPGPSRLASTRSFA